MAPQNKFIEKYLGYSVSASSPEHTDICLDMLSSEYVNDCIYNHPERFRLLRSSFDLLGLIQSPNFVFTIVADNFWIICAEKNNSYRYRLKRTLLNETRAGLSAIHPAFVAATLIGTDKVVALLEVPVKKSAKAAEQYAYDIAKQLLAHLIKATGFSISIGISDFCKTPTLLWHAYEQSFRALQCVFTAGYTQIHRYRKVQKLQERFSGSLIDRTTKQFSLAISKHDSILCQKYLDALFSEIALISADEAYIKSFLVLILSDILQYCINLGLNANELSQELITIIRKIFDSGTLKEIRDCVSIHLQTLLKAQNSDNTYCWKTIDIAHAYIMQYYAEPVSGKKLAALCGYNYSYFSRLFKRTYGVSYTEFRSACRLRKAALLLSGGTSSVTEISKIVGFESLSYFSVTFRKRYGLSPQEYRDRALKTDFS